MDTFIDKLAQKFTAGEMIKGNTAAEAKEIKQLREQVENYENLLQEMKLVNLKNMESAQKVNDLVENSIDSIKQACEGSVDVIKQTCEGVAKEDSAERDYVSELFDKTNDTIHKENVRVYRNVQSAVSEGLEAQTKSIIDSQVELAQNNSKLAKKQVTVTNVLVVVTLIAVLADIAINVLRILRIL